MPRRRVPAFVAALATSLVLAACEKSDQQKLKTDAEEAGKALKQVGETTGQVIEDAAITAKVKAALLAEKNVRSREVDVETFQGKVVLKGRVPDRAQADLALKVARSVEGVKAVESRIAVN